MNSMNKRTIVFLLIAICVAVTLALVVGDRRYQTRATYSEFLQQVQAGDVSKATIEVAETGADSVNYILKNGMRIQTIVPRDYHDALSAMQSKSVNVEIHNAASQPWGVLINASPFLILLGFWFFAMHQMRKQPRLSQ